MLQNIRLIDNKILPNKLALKDIFIYFVVSAINNKTLKR